MSFEHSGTNVHLHLHIHIKVGKNYANYKIKKINNVFRTTVLIHVGPKWMIFKYTKYEQNKTTNCLLIWSIALPLKNSMRTSTSSSFHLSLSSFCSHLEEEPSHAALQPSSCRNCSAFRYFQSEFCFFYLTIERRPQAMKFCPHLLDCLVVE